MPDIAQQTTAALTAFEVSVTVARAGDDDRTEQAVLLLGVEEWHTHGGVKRIVSLDQIAVAETVDIAVGDVITCADLTAVPESTTWTVADRRPSDGDRWIKTWRIVQQGDAI